MDAGAIRWSCARCGVSVGRIDREPTALPDSWLQSDGEIFCLTCSRARAGEVAIESASDERSREDLVRIRRTALIEFEIRRAPEAPNGTIARACRTSSSAVAVVRDTMVEVPASLEHRQAG
jgi:hypothetical protein